MFVQDYNTVDDRVLDQNIVQAVHFDRPDHIPISFHISPACWRGYYSDQLQAMMAAHPILFPNFTPVENEVRTNFTPWELAGKPYTDSWGCVWETTLDGISGTVVDHPLKTWKDFDHYHMPNPEEQNGWGQIYWAAERERIEWTKANGNLAKGALRRGHTFMTLTYIRGFENVSFDMMDEDHRFMALLKMIEHFNLFQVQRYVDLGVDWMGFPEDLGMQHAPMLSPKYFGKYIKPVYDRILAPALDADCIVHISSDGNIRELADDLVDAGAHVLGLQDLVNGIDWIRRNLKGRVCIELDLDRQRITRFGTPEDIDKHVQQCVQALGSREGGLMLHYSLYPGVPRQNIEAVMTAMERYAGHYS